MDYTAHLHDFIDGSLAVDKEEDLFMQLSSNEELRMDMKQLLAMKESIRSYTEVFSPSAESTMKIFSTLGFALPITSSVNQPTIKPASRLKNFYNKYSQGILSGVLSSAVTALLILWLLNPKSQPNSQVNNTSLSNGGTPVIPKIVANNNDDANVSPVSIGNKVRAHRNVAANVSQAIQQTETAPEIKPQTQENLDYTTLEPTGNGMYKLEQNHNFIQPGDFIMILPQKQNKLGFDVELRGSQYWQTTSPTISPAMLSPFNNAGITVYKYLNNDLAVGLDLRQETFFNTFRGFDGNGYHYTFQTQPNYTTIGAVLRYDMNEIGSVYPIGQIMLGGNTVGFVGRLMTGVSYSPYSDISFMLGLEYSDMLFGYQGTYYNSSKIGLNYGIKYKF